MLGPSNFISSILWAASGCSSGGGAEPSEPIGVALALPVVRGKTSPCLMVLQQQHGCSTGTSACFPVGYSSKIPCI